jgi:hypothetical protein
MKSLLQTRDGSVLEEVGDKGNSIGRSPWSEHLGEWVRLDLREFVLHVLERIENVAFIRPKMFKADDQIRLTLGFIVLI